MSIQLEWNGASSSDGFLIAGGQPGRLTLRTSDGSSQTATIAVSGPIASQVQLSATTVTVDGTGTTIDVSAAAASQSQGDILLEVSTAGTIEAAFGITAIQAPSLQFEDDSNAGCQPTPTGSIIRGASLPVSVCMRSKGRTRLIRQNHHSIALSGSKVRSLCDRSVPQWACLCEACGEDSPTARSSALHRVTTSLDCPLKSAPTVSLMPETVFSPNQGLNPSPISRFRSGMRFPARRSRHCLAPTRRPLRLPSRRMPMGCFEPTW